MLILNPKLPILEVGLNCGFSSAQKFSHSFAKKFERCPSLFRNDQETLRYKKGVDDLRQLQDRFQSVELGLDSYLYAEKPRIIVRPAIKVAYVRNIGKYGNSTGISRAAESILTWAESKNIWKSNTNLIGVSWDYSSITPLTMCRYDMCIEIPNHIRELKGISIQSLPGGTFAAMQVYIKRPEDIFSVWYWFYYTLKHSPEFQSYRIEDDIGPWYEIFNQNQVDGYGVDLQVHLHK